MGNFDMTGLRGMVEQMPTDQLDELLQIELEKEQVDEAAVRMIMSVLEARDQNTPVEINEKIEAAWEKYQAYAPVKERRHIPLRGWPMRAVAAVAVIVVLFFVMPQNAEAKGFWERFARWTDSIFEFFSPGDEHIDEEYIFKTDNPGLQQVYDTVVDLEITEPVVPMWLPEGFELVECKVNKNESKEFVYACFSDGVGRATLDISMRSAVSPRQYSKDESRATTKEIAGVVHNILHNNDWWIVVWTKDEIECAIATDCQEETLNKILKSIYAMEDD